MLRLISKEHGYENGENRLDTIKSLTVDVEIKLFGGENFAPRYSTPGAAGMDVRAFIEKPIKLCAGEKHKVPLGFALNIKTQAIVAKLYPRSGMGWKGLILANGTGVIDSDYQGEVAAMIWHRGDYHLDEPITINPGDRIAQLVFEPVIHAKFNVVEEFAAATERGAGGFGSTGVK